jgi:SAM-dependent methyltransferase
MRKMRPSIECPCNGAHLEPAFTYDEPPEGETAFDFGTAYHRSYLRCASCGHWFSHHDMDLSAIYSGTYVDATYGDRMQATFERIMALPPEQSDNAARVARLIAFADCRISLHPYRRGLLDVGSGLAVFPARMLEAGWDCTALDPDPRAAEHARNLGIRAIASDFRAINRAALGQFDAITFNKVLEHVDKPVAMLRSASSLLTSGGFIYVEVPDGEAASAEGPGREEFFIEHHHVFSLNSLAQVADRAGFQVEVIERLREPSGKFTLFAFLSECV